MALGEPAGYDLVTVESDRVTADIIVWRRYRMMAFGVLERMLDDNPHLAKFHKWSPFIPPGVQLRIPIYPDILKGAPQQKQFNRWWETIGGEQTEVLM
jgi:phage tail protein X